MKWIELMAATLIGCGLLLAESPDAASDGPASVAVATAAPVAEVSGGRILASELSAVLGWRPSRPDADLGPSPLPGRPRRVSAATLERWAALAGAEETSPVERLVVRRAVEELAPEAVAQRIAALVAEDRGVPPEQVEAYVAPGRRPLSAPTGKVSWSILGRLPTGDAAGPLRLRWLDGAGRSGVEVIAARVRVRGAWLEATRDLPPRRRLQPEDVTVAEGWIPDIDNIYLPIHEPIEELELVRLLKQGEALTADVVRRRPEVVRGDVLELIVHAGAVVLRTAARAEADGAIGGTIPLRNLETGRRIVGRILTRNSAEAVVR